LALNQSELDGIFQKLTEKECPTLMVGFNRRFAPLSVRLKDFLETRHEPFIAHYRVNAGYLPLNHWLHDPHTGGGRIIGEGCHFIDFLTFLAGSPPVEVIAKTIPEVNRYHQDNVTLTFSFPDRSIGTVCYLANGDKSFAKEYLEVFSGGSIAVLNDFRSLELVKNGRRTVYHSRFTQNKGHLDSWKTFLNAIKTGSNPPIPYDHLYGVTIASFAASRAMTVKESIPIPYHFPAL
jgi:predicted dehydrogenase